MGEAVGPHRFVQLVGTARPRHCFLNYSSGSGIGLYPARQS